MARRHRAKRRDNNEREIIEALEVAGASVSTIDGDGGEPDLLVGYRGETHLLEVKRPVSSSGKTTGGASMPVNGGDGISTRHQLAWRARWQGRPACIVATPAEALAAIGAQGGEHLPSRVVDTMLKKLSGDPLPKIGAKPIPRRRTGLITTDEAKAIRNVDDCAKAKHPRVIGTKRCPCGAWYMTDER